LVASWQAVLAIRVLVDRPPPLRLLRLDAWDQQVRLIDVSAGKRADCPCCVQRAFTFLDHVGHRVASLCGRDAVQIRAPAHTVVNLQSLAARLTAVATVERSQFFIKLCTPDALQLTIFPDGRAIVQGTTDLVKAQQAYDRFVGG